MAPFGAVLVLILVAVKGFAGCSFVGNWRIAVCSCLESVWGMVVQ